MEAITGAVDFAAVVTGIGVIGAAIAGFVVVRRGAGELIGMIRGR
ncbi:hypothetical protein [Marinobacterium iners]|nr:hypothetical protein [Marinobacterium iners]